MQRTETGGRTGHRMAAREPLPWCFAVCILVGVVGALAGCGPGGSTGPPQGRIPDPVVRPSLPAAYVPSGHAAAGDVFVHLFEWNWSAVAGECEAVLGPAGYAAVQVSPPQEHIVIQGRPWWERYQPVSYTLEGRSGDAAAFATMVGRCADAGVDVYVDAVINHMTAGSGTGTAGTAYTKYGYPGLYDESDFHEPCIVDDYQDEANVQDCELLGLADLDTGQADVRATLAGYLMELVRLGVAGFRIDAAKHMQPVELDSIVDLVNETAVGEGHPVPYWFAEVIDHGGEAVAAEDYFGLGFSSGGSTDITEFPWRGVADKVTRLGSQRVSDLREFSPSSWGIMPADKAVIFLQNHDTQRGGGIGHGDGDLYRVAHVWMLGHPYGYPKVMSGYAFEATPSGRDAGPPTAPDGTSADPVCPDAFELAEPGDWTCVHRDPVVRAMVGFRRTVAGTPVADWWDDGADAIAFSRGERGFVAINGGEEAVEVATPTGLPDGTYCDVLAGGVANGACAGDSVTVEAGALTVAVPALSARVFHVEARP